MSRFRDIIAFRTVFIVLTACCVGILIGAASTHHLYQQAIHGKGHAELARGIALYGEGKTVAAIRALYAADAFAPELYEPNRILGDLFREIELVEFALEEYRQALVDVGHIPEGTDPTADKERAALNRIVSELSGNEAGQG